MDKSRVLIITICSNQKIQGGDAFKKSVPSVAAVLPDSADGLFRRRSDILGLIQGGSLGRDGIPLCQMQFNSKLVRGPDFGGKDSGCYLPSSERYAGSFFTAVKRDNASILSDSLHHILIISALYGLLLPDEKIQLYSCHVEDHSDITSIWKKDGFLTSVVLSYMRKFEIYKAFDLTAQESYRELLNWSRISKKAQMLHVFGEQYVGPSLLSSLGEFARDHLLLKKEEELSEYVPGSRIFLEREKIVLTEFPSPPAGFPREQEALDKNKTSASQVEIASEQSYPPTDVANILIMDHPRDITVSSKGHRTIFERPVANLNDIPSEVRGIFSEMSRCPDVLEIFFEGREKGGPSFSSYRLKLFAPQEGTGYIHAKLDGVGQVCHTQDISIRVTKNIEIQVYYVLDRLIKRGLAG